MKRFYLSVFAAVTAFLFTACNEVQINRGAEIAVTDVILNRTSISLHVGAVEVLTAAVFPADAINRNLTWSSSNPDVATVDDNGMVRGISEGTAIIVARAAYGAVSTSCIVAVGGVPINGVYWATCNVDVPGTFANHPEDVGML